ncbi:hypothetical protein [Streptomyces sp. BE133]|uniref:hypothetical protein n=1 Tax=Streptomyces sp. BE133 TaxID=3002523 RepID=UPI002E7A21E4|nr:hypothetical protein [Streptomyces sp. BE133]MEE1808123.1 hypothetical protein [Streptomyces sp. BE133]
MDPEYPGEESGWEFGGGSEQCGGPVLFGPDPDGVVAFADLTVGETAPGVPSWEQPGDVVRGADLGLAAAGRGEFADQAGERRGEDDRRGAEGDEDGITVDVDIVDGEPADGGDLLCVEDQE